VWQVGGSTEQFDVFVLADVERMINSEYLVVAVVNAAVDYTVKNLVSILAASLGHLEYSLGGEGSFSVDEEDFTLQSSFRRGKLSLNTQFHTDLRIVGHESIDDIVVMRVNLIVDHFYYSILSFDIEDFLPCKVAFDQSVESV